jgi:hypothetical protein
MAVYGTIKGPGLLVVCRNFFCRSISRVTSPTPNGRIVCPVCTSKEVEPLR